MIRAGINEAVRHEHPLVSWGGIPTVGYLRVDTTIGQWYIHKDNRIRNDVDGE